MQSNRLEAKEQMKNQYDQRNKVSKPAFQISDWVLLRETRVKETDRVLTQQLFSGPYIVADVIRHNENIGPAYKLVHAKTGKEVRRLVNVDRLKHFVQRSDVQQSNNSITVNKRLYGRDRAIHK